MTEPVSSEPSNGAVLPMDPAEDESPGGWGYWLTTMVALAGLVAVAVLVWVTVASFLG